MNTAKGMRALIFGAIALTFVLGGFSGCKKYRAKFLGIKVEKEPKKETPEWIVYMAMKSAMEKDEAKGWAMFKKLLHSEQTYSANSLNGWRRFSYKRFRKQYTHYLTGGKKEIKFKIARWDDRSDNFRKLFIKTSKSDMPTPILLKKDSKNGGKWRIQVCSL